MMLIFLSLGCIFINCHPEDIVYRTLLCIRDVNVGKRGEDVPFALAHKPFNIAL